MPLAEGPGREVELLRRGEIAGRSGSWMLEAATGTLQWSANLYRIYGREVRLGPPSLQGLAALVHPGDLERVTARAVAMREHGERDVVRHRILVDGAVRHVRVTLGTVDRDATGEPSRLVGVVHDLTSQWRADQQIDAHVAVAESLAAWEGLEPGAHRLLAGLAGALMCVGGVLWVPEEDGEIVARAVWSDPSVSADPFWTAVHDARLARGVGVAGAAWERAAPVLDADGTLIQSGPLGPSAAAAGLGAGLAIPAVCGDEVVAVVELPMDEDGFVTDQLMRSLVGIGHELGQFFSRRRGQLGASRLTARELEVLTHTAQGHTTQQTADALFLSAATVKTHLAHIYTKLDAPERAAAVATALRLGLIA